jgi:hypothetical protein
MCDLIRLSMASLDGMDGRLRDRAAMREYQSSPSAPKPASFFEEGYRLEAAGLRDEE